MSRTKSNQVVIVGAGLFGSIAARLCAELGFHVTVIDSGMPKAGSKPAACLMAPSWMTGLGDKANIGMKVLEQLYDVRSIVFRMNGVKEVPVKQINPRSILKYPARIPIDEVKESVVAVEDGRVMTDKGTIYKGYVLVAAGVWCNSLIEDIPTVQSLMGSALYYKKVISPEIHIWAPYKQSVIFNITPTFAWFGDGTSILAKNFNEEERIQASIKRAKKYGLKEPSKIIIGQRPYIKGEKGYFKQVYSNTWVSTGGAKNGTILAAYQAQQFLEAIT